MDTLPLTAKAFASGTPGYAMLARELAPTHPGLRSAATLWLDHRVGERMGSAKTTPSTILAAVETSFKVLEVLRVCNAKLHNTNVFYGPDRPVSTRRQG